MRIGLVIAKYNRGITEQMEEEAEEAAEEKGVEIEKKYVPGTYDTPLAADRLARRDEIDAVAVLGAIIEGDTDHDKIIGHATAKKLQDIAVDRDKPVTMGITGPGMTAEEAKDRVHYAANAVDAAVEIEEIG
ncbi:MAG: 6,7-dimethyl-8-ribityllumazine synthase [Candidatus Nanohaloarchaea archaeon]